MTDARQVADLLEQGAIVSPFGTHGRVALMLDGQIAATTERAIVVQARRLAQGVVKEGGR